jgi:hypothetical protein
MPQAHGDRGRRIVLASRRITQSKNFYRKDAKNAKKSRKIEGENRQCAEPAFIASIGYSGIERYEPFFLVVRVSFAFFASLR